jgi:GTPase SAR1 family protein
MSTGSSQSRRLFELSMKQGYVDMYTDKMMFYGSAGVGKTCTMKIVAGENPPKIRQSTPIATRPVSIYQMQEMKGIWHSYRSNDRRKICTRISKTSLGRELVEAMTKSSSGIGGGTKQGRTTARTKQLSSSDIGGGTTAHHEQPSSSDIGGGTKQGRTTTHHQQPTLEAIQQNQASAVIDSDSEHGTSTATNHQQPQSQTSSDSSPSTKNSVDPDVLQVINDVLDEMFQLIDQCPETEEPLSYIHKILISDCGGQPQFHEILPIFLKKMSMIVFVFKLSENLSSRPLIEYFEKGKALGTPYESDLTTEQLIQQGLQSLHTHRSSKGDDGEIPRIVMIGTHKDKMKRFWKPKHQESIETKNQKLRDMLLPTFKNEVIYYQEKTNDVLIPMNAKSPGREEKTSAGKIRSGLSRNRPTAPRKLPLQWLALEIILEEITQQLNRGIVSMNECLEVARRLHLDEDALEAALIYLDELSVILYYPEILPKVVFTNPQVILDKISELVKVHHEINKCSPDDADSASWQEFFNHALISLKFLSQEIFKEHYVPGLFQPEHLMKLFRRLFVFASHSSGKYFVPCLLRMLANKELATKRLPFDSIVAPIVLHFSDGPPRRGIFCVLISFLTSPENHFPGPWKLKMPDRSVTPDCLHRNCIQFTIPDADTPCSVTVIDTLLQFEVHVNVSDQPDADFCSSIKRAITAGLQKANLTLGYTNSTPSFAFLCPCGVGDPHPAKIGEKSWKCTINEECGKKFSPCQQIWLSDRISNASKNQTTLCPTFPQHGKF